MIFAHFTLPTRRVVETADFIERTLGYRRLPLPDNSPVDVVWFDLGDGQELHVLHVDGYEISAFEGEFGRHVALLHPLDDFPALRQRLVSAGAQFLEEIRRAPFERFFFREPVNGYVFEIVDSERARTRG